MGDAPDERTESADEPSDSPAPLAETLEAELPGPAGPEARKPKRVFLLVAMWVGAGVAMLFLWLGRDADASLEPPRQAPGVPIRAQAETGETPSRADVPIAAIEEGPPSTFRGDRRHTGRSPYLGPARPRTEWVDETQGRISAQVVADAAGNLYVASHDGKLRAYTSGGRLRWERELGGPVYSTPVVDERGHVYVGSDARIVWAFDRGGNVRWRLETEGDADTGLTLSPEGHLHFGAGKDLYSVTRDGDVRWRFRANEKIFATPAVDDDGTVYVGSQDDLFYAIAADGTQRWSYRTRGDNDGSPTLADDGTIYFGSDDDHVYALTRDGDLRWSVDLEGMVRAPVGLTGDGGVLVGAFGPRPRLVALDADDGDLRWSFPVTLSGTRELGVASGPLVDREGFIYFGAHDDYVYSLAPTGELRWVHELSGDVDASPILLPSGLLVVGCDDRRVYAIGQAD